MRPTETVPPAGPAALQKLSWAGASGACVAHADLAGRLPACLGDWLAGWPPGRLAAWLAGSPVGWLIAQKLARVGIYLWPRVADSPRSPLRESEQRKPVWAGGPAGWAIGKIKPELAHGAVGSSAGGSGRPSGLSRRPARSRPGSNLSNKINDFHIHFQRFFRKT